MVSSTAPTASRATSIGLAAVLCWSTSVGLFRSVIAMVLTIAAYWGAYKFADYKIF